MSKQLSCSIGWRRRLVFFRARCGSAALPTRMHRSGCAAGRHPKPSTAPSEQQDCRMGIFGRRRGRTCSTFEYVIKSTLLCEEHRLEAGSMRVDALRPDNIAYLCQATRSTYDRDGPLYFARDRPRFRHSSMRRLATRESSSPHSIETGFGIHPCRRRIEGAKATTIRVRVSTTLLKTGKLFDHIYLTNLSPSDVVVDLPIDPAALKELGDGRLVLKKTKRETPRDQRPVSIECACR